MKKNIKYEIFAGRGRKKVMEKKLKKEKKVETMGLVIGLFYFVLS